jgi:hypothetical protein
MWATMSSSGFPEEFQGCLAITALRDKAFQDFPLMVNGPPEVVRRALDLHEHLVQVLLPI